MKPELTPQESDTYLKIVQHGTMDDMFDLAYAIGRERYAKEQMESINKLVGILAELFISKRCESG